MSKPSSCFLKYSVVFEWYQKVTYSLQHSEFFYVEIQSSNCCEKGTERRQAGTQRSPGPLWHSMVVGRCPAPAGSLHWRWETLSSGNVRHLNHLSSHYLRNTRPEATPSKGSCSPVFSTGLTMLWDFTHNVENSNIQKVWGQMFQSYCHRQCLHSEAKVKPLKSHLNEALETSWFSNFQIRKSFPRPKTPAQPFISRAGLKQTELQTWHSTEASTGCSR